MAAGAYDHTASLMAWVQLKLTGKWTAPDRLNPWRDGDRAAEVKVTEASNAAGWAALGRMMTEMARGGKRKPKKG